MPAILPAETLLMSGPSWKDGKPVPNPTGRRIETLLHSHLVRLADAESGWCVLYRDPEDQRFWELSFPHGELQRGGPKMLKCLSEAEAKAKFKI